MRIAFNPSTVAALIAPPNNKDITFDLRGQNIFARGVKFCGTDTNTWRDIKINNVSIDSNILDLRDGDNTTLTNINGVVTINSTWRPVVDNLTSDSTTSSLSANLGRVLKALIDGKSDSGHNHDDRYLRLTGGWMSGDINFGSDNKICWGRNTDSASISFKNDGDGDADSYMSFVTSDNGNEYFRWSHSSGSTNTEWMSLRSDGLRVGGTKVSLEGHSHNDLYYTKTEVNNKLNGKSDTGHTHDDRYLKLTGGTMTGIIRATNRGGTWISGRDHCLIRSDDKTSHSYWSAILAIATVNGYWTLGHLGDGGERIGFNYDTDADYNAGRNDNHVIWLPTGGAEGTLALTSDIPTSLKNPYALTLKANGTTLAIYDGSSAKEVNFTYTNIGAASASHTHDDRYIKKVGDMPTNAYDLIITPTGLDGEHVIDPGGGIHVKAHTGTPFQLWLHDTSNVWYKKTSDGAWVKMDAGHADIASSATKLQTSRLLWGQSFDGTADISGNMSSVGLITFSALSGTNGRALLYLQMADNDYFRIYAGGTASNSGYVEIATADDGNEPIYVRQYTGVFSSVKRTLTLLDANGYTHFPSYINIGGNENNNSSPDRVWGSNSSDSYLRSYRTSALNVNYAASAGNADTLDGNHASAFAAVSHTHPYLPLSGAYITGTNIADMKVNIRNYFNGKPAGTNCYVGSPNIIYNFLNDSAACDANSVCGIMALNPGYDNYNHGHFLVSHYGNNRIGMIGLGYLTWYGPNWFAYTSDIPTVTDYYWANIKVSASSSTSTSPTFESLWINNSHFFKLSGTTFTCQGGTTFTLPSSKLNTNTALLWTTASDGSRDTGIFYNSSDFAFIANSNDHGAVFAVYDTDVTQDFEAGAREISVPGNGGALWARGGFSKNGSSNDYVLLGDGGHKAISDFAPSSHSHNYAANENYGGFTKSGRLPISGFYQSNESESGGNAPWSSWVHLINCLHSNTGNNYALLIAASFFDNNTFKIRVTDNDVNNTWRDIIHSGNIGSQTVANTYHLYINSANTWSNWYWAGLGGQPSWLWGSNDGTNMYVWDPNNFNVHTALYLRSLGNLNCQTGRTLNYGDVYSYNTYYGNTGAPTDYTSVIGFGRGIAGTVEIAGGWCNTHLYWRSLRDCCDDWYSWRTVLDSSNYTEFINNYYWANVKISASASTTTSPTVHTLTATRVCAGHNPEIDNSISCSNWFRSSGDTGWYNTTYRGGWYMSDTSWIRAHNGVGIYTSGQIYSPSSIRMGNILLEHTDEINNSTNGGLHLNYRNSGNITLCIGGGNVGISNSSPSYKLDVNGLMRASGFHHGSVNSDNYILLAGGGYKPYGGNYDNPIFLGYLNLERGNDGTISSSFYCLGYSVSFTYTRGGNYCKISIPDTSYQVFYIKAATASVNYSGGGMDTWTGYRRGDGAWWLHCYAYSSNEVRVKGFRQANDSNDSWWGGNPLVPDNGGANRITVCIFGYVTFR